MSSDLETTRVVRAWLRTDEHESADRVLSNVLASLDVKRQRRSRWPALVGGRAGAYAKLALVAAAVVAAVVIGANLLPAGQDPGVGTPTETPSPSPSGSPGADVWPTGAYSVGRHEATIGGISFSFETQSNGWVGSSMWTGMLQTGPAGWIGFTWGFDEVATDGCSEQSRVVGPSVDDLATAMTTIPGTTALEPTDVTVGGFPGKLVEFTINDDIACPPNEFMLFGPHSAYPNSLDSRIKVWIFEVDGERTTIHSDQMESIPALEADIEQIVDSVRFE
jgi:hypothetical protein